MLLSYLCSMANDPKPIKRSRQLTPWSKDHHEGLSLTWKIRQGLKNGTEKKRIIDYVKWFWVNHLEEHFREEEELLESYLHGHAMIGRMFNEHKDIRALVDTDLENAEELEKFAALLHDHIRFEERELFGLAESLIPAEGLDQIESEINKGPNECDAWQDEFWLMK